MRLRPLCSLPVLVFAARREKLDAEERKVYTVVRGDRVERYEPDPQVEKMLRELDTIAPSGGES